MQGYPSIPGTQIIPLVSFALFLALSFPLEAQKVANKKTTPGATATAPHGGPLAFNSATSGAHLRELGDTVALLPWSYRNGKEAAMQSAREVCNQLLLNTGFNVFLIKSATGAMPPSMPNNGAGKRAPSPFAHLLEDGRTLFGQTTSNPVDSSFILPTLEQMAVIGERLQTRYVLAGRAQWRSRNVWIGMSNRVKSICTVDVRILDMDSKRLVLDARNVEGDSTENKNLYNSLTTAISLNPLPLVMPGSVTPQQQRAVMLATARAMEPWLRTERIQVALAQADQSSEAAAATSPTARFSSLVSSLRDIHAMLHITAQDRKQLDAFDADIARFYALQEVSLDYKEPNHLRLRATSPNEGPETLLQVEEHRRVVVPNHPKVSAQDLSNAPNRRLSLLDFCGLLTPGIFDYMRARFVREEKLESAVTVVYDLTYWGIDDGSYQRIWLDPRTHVLVRREMYARGGNLKVLWLYTQPTEIAPHVWVPTHLKMMGVEHKTMASLTVTNAQVNQGLAEALFATPAPQSNPPRSRKGKNTK